MIECCKFHHLGYTVDDIQATASQFSSWGYEAGETFYDEDLTVELCYLTKAGSPVIELVHQRNPSSLETLLLQKNGVIPYHIGYETDDMEAACQELEALGYERLFNPVPVKALGGTLICYFHHPAIGYIEILEATELE